MTEPPEPRRPDETPEDGGEEGPVEVPGMDELLDAAWLDEQEDDMLLDRLGRAEDDRRIGDEMSDAEWDLQDRLLDWQEEIEEVPVPKLITPEAAQAAINEGKAAMSISESARQIREVSQNTAVAGALQQAEQGLNDIMAALQVAIQTVVSDTQAAVSAAGETGDVSEIQGAGEYAGGAAEDAMALVQNAIAAVQQAGQHDGAFRQTLGDVAGRHGG